MPYGSMAIGILVLGSAAFFAHGARAEGKPEWLWAGISLAASCLAVFVLDGRLFLVALSQVLVFAGITAWGAFRDRRELDRQGGGDADP
jgi:hypothetical protein